VEAQASGSVTKLLEGLSEGDERSRLRLIELVYDELRRLAGGLLRQERLDHTLQPTALVHEAWMRLFGESHPEWKSSRAFFGGAVELMRRVLVDYARRRKAEKRGGSRQRVPLPTDLTENVGDPLDQTLGVHAVIDELANEDPRKAEVVKLRFFGGLSVEEVAAVLEVAPITVKRDWRYARAWLLRRLGESKSRASALD
jgi:RNA polymerase sigma factor (TIGR02999 family)